MTKPKTKPATKWRCKTCGTVYAEQQRRCTTPGGSDFSGAPSCSADPCGGKLEAFWPSMTDAELRKAFLARGQRIDRLEAEVEQLRPLRKAVATWARAFDECRWNEQRSPGPFRTPYAVERALRDALIALVGKEV